MGGKCKRKIQIVCGKMRILLTSTALLLAKGVGVKEDVMGQTQGVKFVTGCVNYVLLSVSIK